MSFRDFTFPEVQTAFGLQVRDERLFQNLPPFAVRQEFLSFLKDGWDLASAISTEKAKSEFIIAPILLELKRATGNRFRLFSGVEWDVDRERGLNGFCDFLLTRGASQHFIAAPFLAVVEAKNDLIPSGLGQCIAAMYAAAVANEKANLPAIPIHGIVTTGTNWKFLRLQGSTLLLDTEEYSVDDIPKLMAVLEVLTRV